MKIAEFLRELKKRNFIFFYLSMGLFLQFLLFLIFFGFCHFSLIHICHWLKPAKFSLSFALFAVSLGWYMEYLKGIWSERKIRWISYLITFLILLEMGIILFHDFIELQIIYFSSGVNESLLTGLYHLGNLTISLTTAITAYIGVQFFRKIDLQPTTYLLAIRASFVVFILSATLGAYLIAIYGQFPVDKATYGIPFTRYDSTRDNLISVHFLGIHYLQLLPVSCYFFKEYIGKKFIASSVVLYVSFLALGII